MIQNKLYVNQARVIFTYETKSSSGKKQFLYLIGNKVHISSREITNYFRFCVGAAGAEGK